jgi:hypothetical protein
MASPAFPVGKTQRPSAQQQSVDQRVSPSPIAEG